VGVVIPLFILQGSIHSQVMTFTALVVLQPMVRVVTTYLAPSSATLFYCPLMWQLCIQIFYLTYTHPFKLGRLWQEFKLTSCLRNYCD